jgi:hypothetical protein
MTTLFVLLDTIIFLFEVAKTYELKRTKNKGHDAQTSQPFKH